MTPNVGGNRRADGMVTEDQVVCRRVRLTVRLGPTGHCVSYTTANARRQTRSAAEGQCTSWSGVAASAAGARRLAKS